MQGGLLEVFAGVVRAGGKGEYIRPVKAGAGA